MNPLQYFLLRRLHSLLGVIPLGIFLIAHLTTNFTAIFGAEAFVAKVDLIHSLGPLLPFVETAVIFVPLALHIVLGIVIALQSRNNVLNTNLKYGRNWAYTLQRWTGWVALVFIVYHAGWLRLYNAAAHANLIDSEVAGNVVYFAYMENLFATKNYTANGVSWSIGLVNILWIVWYMIGGVAVIYHFANGLCTFCMTWGITIGPKSQKIMAIIATFVGLGLLAMLTLSIVGFVIHHVGLEYMVPAELPIPTPDSVDVP